MNTKYCTRIIYGCSTKCNKFLKHNSEIMPLSAEHGDELLLALNADGLAYLFAVPESDQRGDAEHAEALSDVRVIVHIELADLDLHKGGAAAERHKLYVLCAQHSHRRA